MKGAFGSTTFHLSPLTFQFNSLLFPEKRKNEEQQHGATGADEELTPERAAGRKAEEAEHPATKDTADEADEDAYEKAHAFFHDKSGEDTGECSNEQRN